MVLLSGLMERAQHDIVLAELHERIRFHEGYHAALCTLVDTAKTVLANATGQPIATSDLLCPDHAPTSQLVVGVSIFDPKAQLLITVFRSGSNRVSLRTESLTNKRSYEMDIHGAKDLDRDLQRCLRAMLGEYHSGPKAVMASLLPVESLIRRSQDALDAARAAYTQHQGPNTE